jgi:hypothetical protein
MIMPDIQGYAYGTTRAARSPITLDELRELEATVGWTEDDVEAIAMAAEVLAGQEEAMVDSWRAIIGNHPSHDQSVARSGTIDWKPLCGTSCLYVTRLLKTPIIGPWAAIVASSWIDMLAGLSKKETLRTPPDFCVSAGPPAHRR